MIIIDRKSLLTKSLSKLFEFSDNLGSYFTGQLVTNASYYIIYAFIAILPSVSILNHRDGRYAFRMKNYFKEIS